MKKKNSCAKDLLDRKNLGIRKNSTYMRPMSELLLYEEREREREREENN
jgi:hypothetical protein